VESDQEKILNANHNGIQETNQNANFPKDISNKLTKNTKTMFNQKW
jgi:hypothetical protein